jgi:chitinase
MSNASSDVNWRNKKLMRYYTMNLSTTQSTAKLVTYVDTLAVYYPPQAVVDNILTNIGKFNHLILAFWEPTKPVDVALEWSDGKTFPTDAIDQFHKAGVKVLVSASGSTETPITHWINGSGIDGATYGQKLADFVKQYQLDGADLDIEDAAYQTNPSEAIQWTVDATKTLRKVLGQNAVITHAPQAPYFSPDFGNAPYLEIDKQVGSMIDFYNIQFYNQGNSSYDTYNDLFVTSNGWCSGSSVGEIHAAGVPLSRIVVGKPMETNDASNTGFVDAKHLAAFIKHAKQAQPSLLPAGVMTWQFHSNNDSKSWSETIASRFGS